MPTNVIVLGQVNLKKSKPIEFNRILDQYNQLVTCHLIPANYKNIELVYKSNSSTKYDIMFAYEQDRSSGNLILGRFNDGFV